MTQKKKEDRIRRQNMVLVSHFFAPTTFDVICDRLLSQIYGKGGRGNFFIIKDHKLGAENDEK